MTVFVSTLYPCFAGIGEVSLQWLFFGRLLGRKPLRPQILPLFLASCACIFLPIPISCKFLGLAALMSLYGMAFCGRPAGFSLFSALLAAALTQLCYGVFQPFLAFLPYLLCPANPGRCGLFCMAAGDFLSLGLAFLCGKALLRQAAQWDAAQPPSLVPAAVPLLLVFLVSSMAAHSFYGNIVTVVPGGVPPVSTHLPILLMQLLGLSSVFCILHIYQKLSLLASQNRLQKQYTAKTLLLWNSTKALRHDMKNHAAVIRGLLEKGDTASAQAYAGALDAAAAGLSPSFQTNRPVCDVLLNEKAALAEQCGISFRVGFQVPAACSVADFDFCILLANALDNAIHACEMLPPGTARFIRLSSHMQGDFLLISMENSCLGTPRIHPGTGLSNIRQAAKKYGGTVTFSAKDSVFHLDILLNISQRSSRISHHTY